MCHYNHKASPFVLWSPHISGNSNSTPILFYFMHWFLPSMIIDAHNVLLDCVPTNHPEQWLKRSWISSKANVINYRKGILMQDDHMCEFFSWFIESMLCWSLTKNFCFIYRMSFHFFLGHIFKWSCKCLVTFLDPPTSNLVQ